MMRSDPQIQGQGSNEYYTTSKGIILLEFTCFMYFNCFAQNLYLLLFLYYFS